MIKKFAEAFKPLNEAKKEKGADIWFSDIAYFKKEHKGYKLKPNDLISIHTPKGDQEMTYAEALKKFESAETVTEAKVELDTADFEAKELQSYLKKNGIKTKLVDPAGPAGYAPVYRYSADKATLKKMIDKFWAIDAQDAEERDGWYELIESKGFASRELIKATDKLHSEQLKLQDLQSKFVTETDPAKKEKLKKQVIDQNKVVKQVERDFQTTLGREEEDIDDMFEATNIGTLTGIEGALNDLEGELADGEIDDILTDIEVAADELPLDSASNKVLKKKVDEIFKAYSKFCVTVADAIAATTK